jgi:hypothetical protein
MNCCSGKLNIKYFDINKRLEVIFLLKMDTAVAEKSVYELFTLPDTMEKCMRP